MTLVRIITGVTPGSNLRLEWPSPLPFDDEKGKLYITADDWENNYDVATVSVDPAELIHALRQLLWEEDLMTEERHEPTPEAARVLTLTVLLKRAQVALEERDIELQLVDDIRDVLGSDLPDGNGE